MRTQTCDTFSKFRKGGKGKKEKEVFKPKGRN